MERRREEGREGERQVEGKGPDGEEEWQGEGGGKAVCLPAKLLVVRYQTDHLRPAAAMPCV